MSALPCAVSADLSSYMHDIDGAERLQDRCDALRDQAASNVLARGGLADFLADNPFADEVICNAITATPGSAQRAIERLREQFDLSMGTRVEREIDRLIRTEEQP